MDPTCRNLGEVRLESEEFWAHIKRLAKSRLNRKQQRVLNLRYVSDNLTLEEIGRKMDLGKERVRQIEAKALRIIRYALTPRRPPTVAPGRPIPTKEEAPFLDTLALANFAKPFARCTVEAQYSLLHYARTNYWVQEAIRTGNAVARCTRESTEPQQSVMSQAKESHLPALHR